MVSFLWEDEMYEIERVSAFYARQPTLVKALGAAALTIALAKIADRQYKN